jgi:hypothetical protein
MIVKYAAMLFNEIAETFNNAADLQPGIVFSSIPNPRQKRLWAMASSSIRLICPSSVGFREATGSNLSPPFPLTRE